MYAPKPIDTSHIKLPDELLPLLERLAENTHDVWAKHRFNEGWGYGVERNDKKKTHPDLVPYSKLSNEEKQYDRSTFLETLKAIIALGFTLSCNRDKEV